jgi:hypothetical protein
MALVVDITSLDNFSPFQCNGTHAFGFIGYVCSTNLYLIFYPSSMYVRASTQLLLYIVLIPPVELDWSRVIK